MPYSLLRVFYRGIAFSIHLFIALLVCSFIPVLYKQQGFNGKQGQAVIKWWCHRTMNILGLTLSRQGKPFDSSGLIVANHISFLDIIVIASTTTGLFLAKSTLQSWPVIGFIANRIGTIFIQRNEPRTLHAIIPTLTSMLQQGIPVIIIPEGTTTAGKTVGKFHSSLYQAAINANKPVLPVAIRYMRNGKPDNIAAYIDNNNFIFSLIKIMAQTRTNVQIYFYDRLDSNNMSRQELAMQSHEIISQSIDFQSDSIHKPITQPSCNHPVSNL